MPVEHDIGFFKNDDGWPDLKIEDGKIKFEIGLQTAVLISLFTDGLVQDEDLPQGESTRRGWWADLLEVNEDQIGSRIWLTDRAKATQGTVNRIIDLATESLQWLLDDGVASRVNVTGNINEVDRTRIDWRVEIFQPESTEPFFFKFVWDGQQQVGFLNGVQ